LNVSSLLGTAFFLPFIYKPNFWPFKGQVLTFQMQHLISWVLWKAEQHCPPSVTFSPPCRTLIASHF
jgi:hypothetical protein